MRTPRAGVPLVLLILMTLGSGLLGLALAEEPTTRIFELRYISAEDAQGLIKPLLTDLGAVSVYRGTNALIVKDTPRTLAQVEEVLLRFDVRPKQVRVSVRFMEENALSSIGANIVWGYRGSHWSVGTMTLPGVAKGFNLEAMITGKTEMAQRGTTSNVLVMSGNRGRITVGRNIPYVDWFLWYSRHYGYYQRTTRFLEVQTGFVVEPVVRSDSIRIAITPEASYFSQGESGVIEYRELSTYVDVKDGQPVVLGGVTEDSESTVNRFMGGSEQATGMNRTVMVLTATVE